MIVVLATATSTLLANVPMTVCACSIDLASSKSPSREVAQSPVCPCGSNCCAPASAGKSCCVKKASKNHKHKPNEKNNGGERRSQSDKVHVEAADCQKMVTQNSSCSIEQRHTTVQKLIDHILIACPDSDRYRLQKAGHDIVGGNVICDPPPTNLVLALHHFII
jgi:hypothetical protein